MSEPAKDMAIEITSKTETPPVRLPMIVAEINRVASRVRERKKKEEEDSGDAEVLENAIPTPSPKPMEITRIIRENTHPRHSSANGCLRSLCYVGLLTALIYVCLILHDVRRFLHKLNTISVSSQLRSLDETLTNLSGNLTTSIADLETTVVNISDSISNVTQVNSFIQETYSENVSFHVLRQYYFDQPYLPSVELALELQRLKGRGVCQNVNNFICDK